MSELRFFFCLLALAVHGLAAIGNVRVTTTNTQAILVYEAPSSSSCTVQVSENASLAPLVHDVNASLFPGADQDTRPGSVTRDRERIFVIGKRAAEPAIDGKRYSRALQTAAVHYYRVQCGADVATGQFQTDTIPLGLTYNDPLPAAPEEPGTYAWPTVSWTDRTQKIIDPHTGALLRRLSLPKDAVEDGAKAVASPPPAPDWSNPSAVTADDSAAATYSGASRSWLFVPAGLSLWQGGYHNRDTASLNGLVLEMNAWCSGSTCSTASIEDRKLQVCLTTDGVSCASDLLEQTLQACAGGCTAANRFTLGSDEPILAGWMESPGFDVADVHPRSGTVNTNGTAVDYTSGHYFSLQWKTGSKIKIGSVEYTIASVDNERQITLTSSAGTQTSASYSTSNFGFLVRKKTASTHQIALQVMRYTHYAGSSPTWDTAGDADSQVACSATTVAGPSGEQGYHCKVDKSIYWIVKDSGAVTRIASSGLPARQGIDGWNWVFSCPGMWDPSDPNTFYCDATNSSGNKVLVKATYQGSNVDLGGPASIYDGVIECGSPPCWTLSNLTPQSTGSLSAQLASVNSDCAAPYPALTHWNIWGLQDKYVVMTILTSPANDLLGCFVVLDLEQGRIVAARTSWKHYPVRWTVLHGGNPIGYGRFAQISSTFARGPFSGSDGGGYGPWRTQITSGAIPATGSACPARPANSPISAAEWPTGNNCIQVTVAGEPCDPSPEAGAPTNPSKCAVASHGYLQDAAVRDVACIQSKADEGCGIYQFNEWVEIILKNGNSWTLRRSLGLAGQLHPAPAGSYLVMMPPTCQLGSVYPCASAVSFWDHIADPAGVLSSSVYVDRIGNGAGHGALRPGGAVWSVILQPGPRLDGQNYGYYDFREGSLPEVLSIPSYFGSSNPLFAGKSGLGEPNEIDSHPSMPHFRAQTKTFFDARPFLGTAGLTGTPEQPGTQVTGALYKFTSAQLPRLRRKILPTLAACGPHTLFDISSPATGDIIGGGAADAYKYCVAARPNECRSGSAAGDAFLNCPQTYFKRGNYLGVGGEDLDQRDMTIADNGALTQAIVQGLFDRQDVTGMRSRVLTHMLGRYRYINVFWNVKATPMGEWAIATSPWLQGQRSDAFLVKIPPIKHDSVSRNTFVPVKVAGGSAPAGANRMAVRFGYTPDFHCTSRDEACYAVSAQIDENQPFLWEHELTSAAGVQSGAGGYEIAIPAISKRVLYCQIVWRNSSTGAIVATGPVQVEAVR